MKSLYSCYLNFKWSCCLKHNTTRITSTAIRLILSHSLDLFSSLRDGKKSLHVPATWENTVSEAWMQGTEQGRPLKACCKYRASVLWSERKIEDSSSSMRFYITTKICIQGDKIDAIRQGHTGSNSAITNWDGKKYIPGRNSLIPLH